MPVTHHEPTHILPRASSLLGFVHQLSAQSASETPKADYTGPVFKIGNIGCGGRGTFVSSIIAENPGFKLTAACDYFEDRVNKFADGAWHRR